MKKRIPLFVVFLLIAALLIFLLIRNQKTGEESGLWVSGTIELTEVDCAFKISGMIEELRFDEGDSVKEGNLIARLDDRELQDRRHKAEASLRMAESRISQVLVAIEHQERKSRGLIAHSRAQRLFATEAISRRQWDSAKAAFETATAQYERAREKHELIREGPRKETIDAARSQVAEAKAAVEVAEATKLRVEELNQELKMAQAQVKVAQADLDLAETLISETSIYAPIAGVVLSKNMERGEIALPGSSILTLGDLSRVWLRAYINETDLGCVKIGQSVEVYTDTYPNKVYSGRLSFISSKTEFTPKQIQTQEERVKLVYRIKIDIDNPLMELKSGMPADATITTENGLEADRKPPGHDKFQSPNAK